MKYILTEEEYKALKESAPEYEKLRRFADALEDWYKNRLEDLTKKMNRVEDRFAQNEVKIVVSAWRAGEPKRPTWEDFQKPTYEQPRPN